MQHLIFVYGTLRENQSNHHFLAGAEFLGMYKTQPEYTLYDLGAYPAVVKGSDVVFGELYLVDDATLVQLDRLEDVPIEYRREQLETPFGRAWIYLYQDAARLDVILSSGDWNQRNKR
ncbi:gamma-glutamylcyclotransferase family protein [Vibrio renipiscarius]|uniref:Gamma-glutamylcyclotransferase family protein n=1 Tax=Vibrio renipiscarius TaxID=1461322 RepID=A0A0C2JKE5_9VIBR|nr:gamma-glutamylcyclotransferase [Vibrio renipiscarius]KII77378.1 gamma-glutamylcyclotransferase [Vibrio renipiscarius]KII78429.1 gamma-glutamylcyclotransferase [Vibrio renipiscarius]